MNLFTMKNSLTTMKTLHRCRNFSTSTSTPIFQPRIVGLHTSQTRHYSSKNSDDDDQTHIFNSKPFNIKPPKNFLGFTIVPEKKAYIVECLGKYSKTLSPGLHFLVPFIYRVSYVHTLKEQSIPIVKQTAITRDNVPITMDGILYIRIIDPVKASYGVEDPINAVVQLAQTVMRSELGKISLDKTFSERIELNKCILDSINDRPLRTDWGVECFRYEIRDVTPPRGVAEAMIKQAEAERKKRATIVDSEGYRQSQINKADGKKAGVILESEGAKIDQINRAKGEADAIFSNAQATAKAILEVSKAIEENGGEASCLRIAEQYIDAFEKIADKTGTTIMLPENGGDVASMVAQAMTVYKKIGANTN